MATLIKHVRTEDFAAWAQETAESIERGRFEDIDLPGLAEEVRDLASSEYRAILSQLQRLFTHLIKWAYQPGKRSLSWEISILDARLEIAAVIEDSPSLRSRLTPATERVWGRVRKIAALETGLPRTDFPEACPWDLDKQVLDEDWLPEIADQR